MNKTIRFLIPALLLCVLALGLVSCGEKYISGTYRATIWDGTEAVVTFHDDGTMEQTIFTNGEAAPVQHLRYVIKNNKIRIRSTTTKEKTEDRFVQSSDASGNYIEYGGFRYYEVK